MVDAASRARVLRRFLILSAAALVLLPAGPLTPQPLEAQLTRVQEANWRLAERFSSDNLDPLSYSSSLTPRFINETDEFWYEWQDSNGTRWMRVNPAGPSRAPLFDHIRMAELLTQAMLTPVDHTKLELEDLEFTEDGESIRFTVDETRFEFHLASETLEEIEMEEEDEREWRDFSPDSTAYVYAQDHNLYLVEIVDGVEGDAIQISHDGEEDYSFGSREVDEDDDELDEEEREIEQRTRPNAEWSEDSQRFLVTRRDRREVNELYLVNSLTEPRPELVSYRYEMPGEEEVSQWELHLFDRPSRDLRVLEVDRWKDQRIFNMHWPTSGSERMRVIRRDRLQRNLELIEVDLASDEITVLVTESTENAHLRHQSPQYLDDGGDFLWYSRRTGWAHYYRYSHDGEFRNAVTSGPWNVMSVAELDSVNQVAYIRGVGREEGENPYYSHLYRVNANGSGLTLLDPGDADQNSWLSPSFRYVVNRSSRVDLVPEVVLRDANGNVILELERMDLSRVEEMGWRLPETFVVKAEDGVTDIYGNLYKPYDFDPDRRYPIIAHVYPGPQTESVRTGFTVASQQQELAQLGFIVIQLGNRGGNPARSAAYHSYGYFNLRDYGLADKKTGIQQLAALNPWIDDERVGIYGHSGGGFMTAAALLQPPYNEFFTVGVSSAGNHDNNVYNQNWSEQHHGLREVTDTITRELDDGTTVEEEVTSFEIHVPPNHELAENLVGRLLLVHGDMDNNVHHAGTMRLAKALIDADKRFDFMMFPGMAHGFGGYSSYWRRMMFEYFAEHLLGDYYRDSGVID